MDFVGLFIHSFVHSLVTHTISKLSSYLVLLRVSNALKKKEEGGKILLIQPKLYSVNLKKKKMSY